jgi:hypothetical protein
MTPKIELPKVVSGSAKSAFVTILNSSAEIARQRSALCRER